jgi:integrase
MASTQEVSNHKSVSKSSSDDSVALLADSVRRGEEHLLFTGSHARQASADLDELRRLRLKVSGGSLFKRPRSRFWQIKYRVGEKWRYESTGLEKRSEAERKLAFQVYQASAGQLPTTATFEQIIEHLCLDAKVRGLKSVARIQSATAQLIRRLEGHRAEQINRTHWLKYIDQRSTEAKPDTIHLELSMARRAYRLARADGLVVTVPDIPQIRHLHVRSGFVEPRDWARVREHLRAEFRDVCDFAFACGAREMEALTLQWSDIEPEAQVVHFRETKTDTPRKIPFGDIPQLKAVIERREAARAKLERAGIIAPWVFCFDEPVTLRGRLYHRAGDQMFKAGDRGGLPSMLRANLADACTKAKVPQLLFHDFRRSAARNFERAGVPRSIARMIGGWSDRIYSRYAIGAESELGSALAQVGHYLGARGWHSGGTPAKTPPKRRGKVAEGGESRTLRQAQCLPSRF